MADSPEVRLGRYDILAELGRGTTAVVYRAWDTQLERTVAVKIFRPDIASLHESDGALKRRFQQEAMAAGRLAHRSIVSVFDVGEVDGTPYIVMEHVAGPTLAELVAGSGRLAEPDAVRLALQLCDALHYAHENGVVHRDIKPGNILVGDDGIARLTDFGIARIVGTNNTQTGAMLGTPAYMSPEQVKGQAAGPASDVFALGVVLYEALTGVSPFAGDDIAAVLYRIVHVDPAPARAHAPDLSPALEAVVARALAKEPEERYATAEAFADALRRALTSPTAVARPPAAEAGRRRGRRRPSRRPLLAGALACGLVLAVGTWAGSTRAPEAPRRGTTAPATGVASEAAALPATAASAEPRVPAPQPPPALVAAPVPAGDGERPAGRRVASAVATAPRPPRTSGSIVIVTDPAVDVLLDGALRGRTDGRPFVIGRVPAGEHEVVLRRGGRWHRLPATVTADRPVRLGHRFGDAPAAAAEAPRPAQAPRAEPARQQVAAVGPVGCLAVNAIPFATVWVDGRFAGHTPKACLRLPLGERRVRFEAVGEQSPERVLTLTTRHTPDEPIRLSYDFTTGRFVEE